MAATVIVNESNGAGETQTFNISTSHYGTSDAANIATAITQPIAPGNNSFEKYQKLETDGGTFVQVDTIRIHRTSGAIPGGNSHLGSQDTGTPSDEAYAQPVDTASSKADTAIPTSDPAVASISGTLTGAGDESGYWVHQVQLTGGATDGHTTGNIRWSWREIA